MKINFTDFILDQMFSVEERFLKKEASCLDKQVYARMAYLSLIPTYLISSVLDLIIGLGALFASLATCGKKEPIVGLALKNLHGFSDSVSISFLNFLKFINPQAKIDNKGIDISYEGNGLLTDTVKKLSHAHFTKLFKKDSYNVELRLAFVIYAIIELSTRFFDGVIGLVAGILSLATLGKITIINNVAYRGLQTVGVFSDCALLILKVTFPESYFNAVLLKKNDSLPKEPNNQINE